MNTYRHHTRMVFYDGYCNLCSRTVQWIKRNDPKDQFQFKPLQDTNSLNLAMGGREGISPNDDTVILVKNGKVYKRSAAILRIATRLRFPWPLMAVFFVVPRFLRDAVYRLVAKYRKRWFGVRTTCYLP